MRNSDKLPEHPLCTQAVQKQGPDGVCLTIKPQRRQASYGSAGPGGGEGRPGPGALKPGEQSVSGLGDGGNVRKQTYAAEPDGIVTLAHGSGGRLYHRLVEEVFLPAFDY